MIRVLTTTEVEAQILSLLDEMEETGNVVEITKHGRTVARLVPAQGPNALKGSLAGVAVTAVDDERDLFNTGANWSLD